MTGQQRALFDAHTMAFYRHPALWPAPTDLDVSLDEQARWIWPASFPLNDDTRDADDGREYWSDGDWTVRDAYRNWTQERDGESLATYIEQGASEW